MPSLRAVLAFLAVLVLFGATVVACSDDDDDDDGTSTGTSTSTVSGDDEGEDDPDAITVYSGRNEGLIGPLIDQFEEDSGINVNVKYGDTAELAALLVEEGDNSPADVYLAQDAGALGAVSDEGLFDALPEAMLAIVDEKYRSTEDLWIGLSGRARVIVYNPELVNDAELPRSVLDLAGERWNDVVGWPQPTARSSRS